MRDLLLAIANVNASTIHACSTGTTTLRFRRSCSAHDAMTRVSLSALRHTHRHLLHHRALLSQQKQRSNKATARCARHTQTRRRQYTIMASSVAAGTIAAFAAPLSMSVGLFAWGENWKGSAFALNLFKNATATVAFLAVSIVAAYVRGQPAFAGGATAAGWLVCSGLIGIVVGDTLWLQALARIGAARTIFVDALKPFTAAVFGRLFLNEAELSALAYVGVALTSVGVTVAAQPQTRKLSDEEEEVEEFQDSEKKAGANTFALGYAMALGNVILDTYGAVLTKQHGSQSFTAFEISAIRFGCSAAILLATGLAARMWARFVRKHRQLTYDLDTMTMPPPSSSWADMPRGMTSKAWLCVLGGVTLTTFTASVLGVYAVMRLPLGVYAALTSLGPVISLPLGYLVRGDRVTPWNAVGACLACAGVAMVVTSTG